MSVVCGAAKSNTNLVFVTGHVSASYKQQQQRQKQQQRNSRIRKHEAIRMANRNHPVFLSATLRNQIQTLLRGENILDVNPADDDDEVPEQCTSDRQAHVKERLHQEGFTKKQARTAFQKESKTAKHAQDTDAEDQWERLYDDCLQWLCVHLEEDQLPEGFDPRGATLEIVATGKTSKSNQTSTNASTPAATAISPQAQMIANKYGVSGKDAMWLLDQTEGNDSDADNLEHAFWKKCCELANVDSSSGASSESNVEENQQILIEEMEALEAIFPSECQKTESSDGKSTITIHTPDGLVLKIVVDAKHYPAVLPERVVCLGSWPSSSSTVGIAVHVELTKFLSTMTLGEPMVFEIYGQMQLLLQTVDELPSDFSLTASTTTANPVTSNVKLESSNMDSSTNNNKSKDRNQASSSSRPRPKRRPRERGVFWSTPPTKTPPAVSFPKLSSALESQRKGLPAGQARQDFLSVLKQADDVSRPHGLAKWKALFRYGLT